MNVTKAPHLWIGDLFLHHWSFSHHLLPSHLILIPLRTCSQVTDRKTKFTNYREKYVKDGLLFLTVEPACAAFLRGLCWCVLGDMGWRLGSGWKPQNLLAHRSRRAGVVQGLVMDLQERRGGLTQRPAIAATGYSVIRSPFSFTALGTYYFQCAYYARCIDYLLVNILFR